MENECHGYVTRSDNRVRYLIVNADDFGYYDCVSKGIIECAEAGAVTATGIFANSPYLETHLSWLKKCRSVDAGVHLNLTDRAPLTSALQSRLRKWDGNFPGKFVMARLILSGRIPLGEIAAELRAQIQRCRLAGIRVSFLNSHEHIHMLPPVFRVTQDLAEEYSISHVRFARPDFPGSFAPGPLLRDLALQILRRHNRGLLKLPVLPFLGMTASGKLNVTHLRRILARLNPGVYELMCHPGICGNDDVPNPGLRGYHDWRGEFDALMSTEFRRLCELERIRLIGYRQITVKEGRIEPAF